MEDNKYENIIRGYTDRQILCEMQILKTKKQNLYIQEKELENEIKRRIEEYGKFRDI